MSRLLIIFALVVAQGRGHVLYGDLRVELKGPAIAVPMNFLVSLVNATGTVMARDNVPANGRYRFPNVPNGEYDIVIERDMSEIGRMRLLIQEMRFTDIRKDISLVLTGDAPKTGVAKARAISAADVYARAPEASTQFEKALEAGSKKDFDAAIAILRKIVAADAKDHEAWVELGTMQFMKADHDAAEISYARALEEKPSYFVALLNQGKLRIARKQFDGAIESLSKAVELQPGSADAIYFLGEAYLQNRKGSRAVGYLNEAIRLDPSGKADAHLRLATLYNAANMKDKAAVEYELFLSKRPDYPDRKKLEQYIKNNKMP